MRGGFFECLVVVVVEVLLVISKANHDAASSIDSSVCPLSRCQAMWGSRRISQRPCRRTVSSPRTNSGDKGAVIDGDGGGGV